MSRYVLYEASIKNFFFSVPRGSEPTKISQRYSVSLDLACSDKYESNKIILTTENRG